MRTLLVSEVAAIYPPEAKAAGVQGTIVVRAIIATDGTVQSATLAQGGPDSLAAAAIAAVRQYRYRPYLLNGEPHEVDTTVYVQFRLDVPETAQHH
jgi:protein TonB